LKKNDTEPYRQNPAYWNNTHDKINVESKIVRRISRIKVLKNSLTQNPVIVKGREKSQIIRFLFYEVYELVQRF